MRNMKLFTSLLCASVVALLTGSCGKDSPQSTHPSAIAVITGKWELRQLIADIGVRDYPSGNGSIYIFTDSSYSIFEKNILVKNGSYSIIADSSIINQTSFGVAPGQFTQRIIFDQDSSVYNGTLVKKNFFQVNGKRLIFIAGYFYNVPFADGVAQTTYAKQ